MDKYKKQRIAAIKLRLCDKLNVSEDWLEAFINQKNICWGRGRSLGDLIDENEFDVVEKFLSEL